MQLGRGQRYTPETNIPKAEGIKGLGNSIRFIPGMVSKGGRPGETGREVCVRSAMQCNPSTNERNVRPWSASGAAAIAVTTVWTRPSGEELPAGNERGRSPPGTQGRAPVAPPPGRWFAPRGPLRGRPPGEGSLGPALGREKYKKIRYLIELGQGGCYTLFLDSMNPTETAQENCP